MKNLVRLFLLGLTGATAIATAGDQTAPSPPAPAAPPAVATPTPPAGEPEDFVPSEKLGADDAVAFPVGI